MLASALMSKSKYQLDLVLDNTLDSKVVICDLSDFFFCVWAHLLARAPQPVKVISDFCTFREFHLRPRDLPQIGTY